MRRITSRFLPKLIETMIHCFVRFSFDPCPHMRRNSSDSYQTKSALVMLPTKHLDSPQKLQIRVDVWIIRVRQVRKARVHIILIDHLIRLESLHLETSSVKNLGVFNFRHSASSVREET